MSETHIWCSFWDAWGLNKKFRGLPDLLTFCKLPLCVCVCVCVGGVFLYFSTCVPASRTGFHQ